MNVATKRFTKRYQPIYDAVARLSTIDQEVREEVARALTISLKGQPDFKPELFQLLASDPLVDCAGSGLRRGMACPHDRRIRVAMHDSTSEDGRAASWRQTMPEVRCTSCGFERMRASA